MKRLPDIIYILSDQHNPEVSGHAGDPYARTPNLDALFRKGVSLENCYAAAPLCVPSRSAILSGRLPCHTGVYNNMQALRSDQATFVNSLTVGGYETVLSGRMHFVGPDQRHGYEKRFVGDITPSHIGADNEELIYGTFKRSSGQNLTSIAKSGAGHSAVLDFDREVVNAAMDHIRERRDTRPLFLTLGFYGPHCPYIAPPNLYRQYYDALPAPERISGEYRKSVHPAIRDWYANRSLEEVAVEDVRRIRAAYYGMVEYLDGLIGEALETVYSHLDPENTLVIYGSDHGDNIGKHGLFWKTNFYDGAARVPMTFSWQGRIPENIRLTGVSSLLDLAPTLLSITGCPALPHYDGVDISSNLFSGEAFPDDRIVIAECSDIKGDKPSAMARSDRYKLVVHAGHTTPQLFDMEQDPDEEQDLGGDPACRWVAETLKEHLFRYWNPERAQADLATAKRHFQLMRQWVETVLPDPLEEWHGDNRNNYLLDEKEWIGGERRG